MEVRFREMSVKPWGAHHFALTAIQLRQKVGDMRQHPRKAIGEAQLGARTDNRLR